MTPDPEKIDAVPAEPVVELSAWRVTDVGMVREHNEDSSLFDANIGFFIVADGMGGHAAGEVASAMTVESVAKSLTDAKGQIAAFARAPDENGRRAIVQTLQSAVLTAHQSVFARGTAEEEKQGMGTTLDVLLIAGAEAFVAHVGDSRTYLLRNGQCSQITTDHTVAEVLVIEGKLTAEEAAVSPMRTVLVNAIGVSAEVGVEMAHLQLRRDDRLLVCSDGLHDYFPSEDEIAEALAQGEPEQALKDMVEAAKDRGGHDNITGIAVLIKQVRSPVRSGDFHERDSTQPVDLSKLHDDLDDADEPPTNTRNAALESRATQPMRAISSPGPVAPLAESTQPLGRVTPPIGLRALAHADTLPPDIRVRANDDGTITVLEPNAERSERGNKE